MKFVFLGIMLFTVLILVMLGVMVKYYKAYWLISGYNTMSQEKKKNVDVEGLAKFIGNMCFIMAGIMLIATVFFMVEKEALGGIVIALMIPVSILIIFKGQKYDGNTRNPDGTMKKGTKIIVGGISSFLLLTLVGVGVLIYFSNQPTQFVIADGHLEIKGIYGEKIAIENINNISLKDSLPKIIIKNLGSSLGSKKKGSFRLEDIGNAKLFVDTAKPPFIYIETAEKLLILNSDDREETEELFQALVAELEKSQDT